MIKLIVAAIASLLLIANANAQFAGYGPAGGLYVGQGNAALPLWNPLSGDCTLSAAGLIVCTKTNGVNFYTGLPSPVNANDAATKQYVDNTAVGLTPHTQSRLATAAALPTNTYNNGTAGVGATLTATTNAALTVDGVAVASGNRIVVKNEAAPANNGIYTVTATGDGSNPYVLTRATDANSPGIGSANQIGFGVFSFVTSGTANGGSGWSVNSVVTTIGTSAINWVQFTGGGGITSLNGLNGSVNIAGAGGLTVGAAGSTVTVTCPASSISQVGCNKLGATLQATPTPPLGVSTSSGAMLGIGTTCHITPAFSGRLHITINGYMSNTVATGGAAPAIHYGSGSAPAFADPPAGTALGLVQAGTSVIANAFLPFSLSGVVTGLSVSTPYWIDIDLIAFNGGIAGVHNVTCSALEF